LPLTVDPTNVSGTWLRHIARGRDPRSRPSIAPDGRWQRGTTVDALYLASDEDGMWAEWYRHLAESGIPPLRSLPRDAWTFAVGATRVADLSTPERLDAVGLTVPPPGSRAGSCRSLRRAGWTSRRSSRPGCGPSPSRWR
jgi:hypothetical protein